MAFKSKATPNIGLSSSASQVTPAVSAGQTATIIGLSISNTTGGNITVSAKLNKSVGSVSAFLIKDATLLPGGTLVIIGGDQKVVLEEGDTITSYSSVASSADAIMSYLV